MAPILLVYPGSSQSWHHSWRSRGHRLMSQTIVPHRALHSRACTALRWSLGISSQVYEGTSQESCREHQTDFRRTDHSSYTSLSGSMPQFRPLVSLPSDGDGVEALTPGHFLIGCPLEALPDPPSACQSITVLRRWNLCQALTRHFWKRWSTDYFASLRRLSSHPGTSRLETVCCCRRTASFRHLVRSLLCTQAKSFESSPYEPLVVPTRGQSSR